MQARQKILAGLLILTAILLAVSFMAGRSVKKEEKSRIKEERADLNNNALNEVYTLAKAGLAIVEDQKIIWQSPSEWQIDDFVLADANNDGVIDLNLSLWKAGSFGTSKPFWIQENDPSVRNHFFIYDIVGDKIKMIWGSSNLGAPNCELAIADMDNDGKNELLVIEGEYGDQRRCRGEYVALWRWNGWGFANDWRSPKGHYANLEVAEDDKNKRLKVDSGQEILFFSPFVNETQ